MFQNQKVGDSVSEWVTQWHGRLFSWQTLAWTAKDETIFFPQRKSNSKEKVICSRIWNLWSSLGVKYHTNPDSIWKGHGDRIGTGAGFDFWIAGMEEDWMDGLVWFGRLRLRLRLLLVVVVRARGSSTRPQQLVRVDPGCCCTGSDAPPSLTLQPLPAAAALHCMWASISWDPTK